MDSAQAEKLIAWYFRINESTKYVAAMSLAFLVCEMVDTFQDEVEHVWGTRWSFGRVIYHINRVWGPVRLISHLVVVFNIGLPKHVCRAMYSTSFYAVFVGMMITGSILIMRIWAIYGLSPWKVIALATAYILACVPLIVVQATNTSPLIEDPAVEDMASGIVGCPLKLSNRVPFALHITAFTLQTVLFLVAVYKPWTMKQWMPTTSLIRNLIQSDIYFYATMGPTLLLLVLVTLHPEIGLPLNSSGFLAAVSSSMCTRLILTTRKWNASAGGALESLVEMDVRTPIVFRPHRESIDGRRGDVESG